jgi:hypothetical protein
MSPKDTHWRRWRYAPRTGASTVDSAYAVYSFERRHAITDLLIAVGLVAVLAAVAVGWLS